MKLRNALTEELQHRAFAIEQLEVRADGPTASIAGYGVVWGSRNTFGEVFVPGCFAESLAEKGDERPLVMRYQHYDGGTIGKWTEHREDETGLYLDGTVSDTAAGRDVSTLVRDGVVTGLSIGFAPTEELYAEAGETVNLQTPYGPQTYVSDKFTIYIVKARIVEVSLCFNPSDDLARLTQVRSELREKAERALPGLRDGAPWEDVAYSMALLMGGRGAGAFADVPAIEQRSLYDGLSAGYAAHGKTPPPYERAPDYQNVSFRHDERAVFHDRYLRKTLDSVIAGARGADGPLSAATRETAQRAVDVLAPLTREPAEDSEALAQLRERLDATTQSLKGAA
jgi:HK97 family phage prohead protease